MITEMCMTMGWTDDHVLKMPMLRFTVMLKKSKVLIAKRDAEFYHELCDIASISIGNGEYAKSLKDLYRKRFLPAKSVARLNNPRVFNADDKAQADQAAEVLKRTFEQAGKVKR